MVERLPWLDRAHSHRPACSARLENRLILDLLPSERIPWEKRWNQLCVELSIGWTDYKVSGPADCLGENTSLTKSTQRVGAILTLVYLGGLLFFVTPD